MAEIRVGVVGATGYTGSELVRLLLQHPHAAIEVVTSHSHVGKRFHRIHPQFQGLMEDELEPTEAVLDHKLDVVFLALPHGTSMDFVARYGTRRFKIIDLSGDFRLADPATYRRWYQKEHIAPDDLKRAAFGLPELFRHQTRNARLVANPGCYPTSAILALAPLLKQGLIEPEGIIVDSKSGVTGAGIKPKATTHFPTVFGNFAPYGLLKHRHTPEIQDALGRWLGRAPTVLFTPHLLPIDRGILTTVYAAPAGKKLSREVLREAYRSVYRKEHFIRLLDGPPNVKAVRGSNFCDIHATYDARTKRVVAISAIDNLVKGAAGQAVQNMNVMFSQLEHAGLEHAPLAP
jgi:N-acetyl-gamma-glutamyl-phosphate reductase